MPRTSIKSFERLVITEPTSAYEVLRRVIEAIEAESFRLRMGLWYYKWPENSKRIDKPSCNTSACIAGWISIISNVVLNEDNRPKDFPRWDSMVDIIFAPHTVPHNRLGFALSSGNHCCTKDGSLEQAELTISLLRDLMAKYADVLKRRIILPGGKVRET